LTIFSKLFSIYSIRVTFKFLRSRKFVQLLNLCVTQEQEPKVFASDKPPVGNLAINDRKEFNRCFNVFTEGLLRDLDWNNVFVAGGMLLFVIMASINRARFRIGLFVACSREVRRNKRRHPSLLP
jgi:hypothetical protein